MKQQNTLFVILFLLFLSCGATKKSIKDANPGQISIPDYENSLTRLNYYVRLKNFNLLDYLIKVDFQDTLSRNINSDLRFGWQGISDEPLRHYNEKQNAQIDTSVAFVEAEQPITKLPKKFKNYMLNGNNGFLLGHYEVIDSRGDVFIFPESESNGIEHFDHPLKNDFSSTMYLFRAPIYDSCATFQTLDGSNRIYGIENAPKCLIFNPFLDIYESGAYDLWVVDYSYYIHCNFIPINLDSLDLGNTSKYYRFRDETQLTKKEANEYARVYVDNSKKIFQHRVTAFQNFLIDDFNNNQAEIHKSYFELILWQIYYPSNFGIGKLDEDLGTLFFTSNNPDYPGNYEVKFNIYKPYNFKVFKR
jgi:hypothetical protein